jgi:F420-non-reducing hydrogenase iron-sulfur subunit
MSTDFEYKPRILGFLCNWCCYAGADLAGVSRFQYPPNIRIIRLMCSGRVDAEHILRAFSKGVDGVFIGGCWLGECHYVTEGNYDALSMMHLCRASLKQVGINPERLRLEWVSASEGIRFAEVISDFTEELKRMGPLGAGEGLDENALKLKLEAVKKLIPYTKLVERERLRVRFDNQESYAEYFASDELHRLFDELVTDNLSTSQIMLLLREKPQTTVEIAETLKLTPSEVSRHLRNSSKHGLVRYDEGQKRYALS